MLPEKLLLPKSIIVLFMIFLFPIYLFSQDFDNYIPTESQGIIPIDLTILSGTKYKIAKKKIPSNLGYKKRRDYKRFLLKNSFVLDELLTSGQLIFNDRMSVYVNKVIDNIMKDHSDIRATIKLYIVRSPDLNAFATDRGEIFVNIGLLTKIRNESELAFILCHEIQHYIEEHNLNSFLEFEQLKRTDQDYRKSKDYELLLEKHSYDRELELEADQKGLELFLKTGYSLAAAKEVFDLLSLSHTSYSNEPFDTYYFDNEFIKIGAQSAIEKVKAIESRLDRESNTHPSLEERKEAFEALTKTAKFEKGSLFIQPKADFDLIQKIARFDLCDILIEYRQFASALYHSYVLLKKYPNNSYAEKNIVKAVYGAAQYKNEAKYSGFGASYKSIEGEIQRAVAMIEKINKDSLNQWAGRLCWDMHQKYPKDQALEYMAKDMIEDIILYGENTAVNIKWSNTFKDVLDDPKLKKWIDNGTKYKIKQLEEDSISLELNQTLMNNPRSYRKILKSIRKNKIKGKYLDKEGVIVINPFYIAISRRGKVKHIKSEKKQKKFKKWIEYNGKDLGLKTIVLDLNQIAPDDSVGLYNEIVTINRWTDELLNSGSFMISSNYNRVKPILEKYGVTTIMYTGVVSVNERKHYGYYYLGLPAAAMPIFAPLALKAMLTRLSHTHYYAFVFDVAENGLIHVDTSVNQRGVSAGLLRAQLYWTMLQLKRSKKEE